MENAKSLYEKADKEFSVLLTSTIFSGLAVELLNKSRKQDLWHVMPLGMIACILLFLVVVRFMISEKGSVGRNKNAMEYLHMLRILLAVALSIRFGGVYVGSIFIRKV